MAKISQNVSRACKMKWLLVRQITKFYLTNKELIQNVNDQIFKKQQKMLSS